MHYRQRERSRQLTGGLVILGAWLCALGLATAFGVSPWYIGWLATCTVVTAGAFAYDKRTARRGGWRVPERRLQLLTFVGGGVGALLAMVVLRHKTRHRSFWVATTAAVALHTFALLVLALRLW